MSPDSTAFDSVSYSTTAFIVWLDRNSHGYRAHRSILGHSCIARGDSWSLRNEGAGEQQVSFIERLSECREKVCCECNELAKVGRYQVGAREQRLSAGDLKARPSTTELMRLFERHGIAKNGGFMEHRMGHDIVEPGFRSRIVHDFQGRMDCRDTRARSSRGRTCFDRTGDEYCNFGLYVQLAFWRRLEDRVGWIDLKAIEPADSWVR